MSKTRALTLIALAVLIGIGSYFIARSDYLLFHSFADMVTVFIAAGVFIVAWNGRRFLDNSYILIVGIAFLFFSIIDFFHLLGNKNMGVFTGYGNLGPPFYIASRYLLGASLLIAPIFIKRKLNIPLALAIYTLFTVGVIMSILVWRNFPTTFIDGVGLTTFKVVSDYIVCGLLAAAIVVHLKNRRSFEPRVLNLLIAALVMAFATGLAFTLYTDPFGITNMVGHFFQIGTFALFYVAFVETALTRPQDILYRNLKQSNEEVRRLNVDLEERVKQRTAEVVKERQRIFNVLETLPAMVCLLTPDHRNVYSNKAFLDRFGESNGRRCYEYVSGFSEPCPFCEAFVPLKTGQSHRWEYTSPDGSLVLDVHEYPFTDVDGSPLILEMNMDITEQRKSEKALIDAKNSVDTLARRLLEVQEEERRSVARELHDEVGQSLTVLKLMLARITRDAPESLKPQLSNVSDSVSETMQAVRSLSLSLRPGALDTLGLVPALEWLFDDLNKRAGLDIHFVHDAALDIPHNVGTTVYRITQEAMTNIMRHSGVKEAWVRLEIRDGKLDLTIEDRGRGFDIAALGRTTGISAMRERAALLGGVCLAESEIGRGTSVKVSLPLP
ncbi:MAG: MASE3 domain-containing protein [Dehalogenimonas sp.]